MADYWRLIGVVVLAGLIGLLVGQPVLFMFIASFLYALWLQQNWFKLSRWIAKPKKNPSPSAEGVIDDVCRDIERIRQQNNSRKKKLASYLKRFQSATAALPDAIVVLGELGEVDWANDSAKTLLGITWPRDSNVRVNNLIRDPEFQQFFIDSEALGETITVASPINTELQLEIKIVKYMGSGRMLLARDMTKTVKLQKIRRDFVANVSHELRTPLTVLRGYLEMFDDKTPIEQWQNALPAMRQQSGRMSNMLNELLTLSRLETDDKALQVAPIDISHLLQEIIAEAKQLTEFNLHYISLSADSEYWLLADIEELRSAVSNLVYNAVKYTPPGSEIAVGWQVDGTLGQIVVGDNGEGIAEHHIERLTERFYRVDSGRSQSDGGTGLGLAIVKHVLQRHDASLEISSELGKGTRFECCFPISAVVSRPQSLNVAIS